MTPDRRNEFEEIVEAALRLTGEARMAYLERTCGVDAEMRREVESLLAQESRVGKFLEQPALEVAARALAADKPGSLAGQQLGPYRVESLISSGGMGQVYRARDSNLGRNVALKVLPEAFADSVERSRRLKREAQVLASLSHPNIATIHGLEESEGVRALVMELVEGPTLAERIGGRAMPLEEALPIAQQIADGLEYAHERGIIHRDLKPPNVKLTVDGNVKLLDFGLAKALEGPAPVTGDPSVAPTLTVEGTEIGVILGTAAYMAPEQARGAVVDKRADIWAFGVVFYEMLSGKLPFEGTTVSDTLAAVLKTEPDWEVIPVAARRLIKQCLQKDPKRRLRDIGDSRILLDEITGVEDAPLIRGKSFAPWAGFAMMIIVAVSLGVILWRVTRPVSQPLMRLAISLQGLAEENPSVIVSPDGTRVVYTGHEANAGSRLYMRRLDQEQSFPLEGTEGGTFPFFSPDGTSVGFFTPGKLKKVAIEGGPAVVLCTTTNVPGGPSPGGGSWGEDDKIVAALSSFSALSQIDSSGGTPRLVTELSTVKGEFTHRWPQVLPGAQAVLFTTLNNVTDFDQATIDAQSLPGGGRKTLVRGGYYGRYVPTGNLVYVRQGTLYSAPMDVQRLEVTGAAVPILADFESGQFDGFASVDFSQAGTAVYLRGRTHKQTLVLIDRAGRRSVLRATPATYFSAPRFSPDGKRLAISLVEGGKTDVWVYELERGTMTRLTNESGFNTAPVWSPDGRHIAFASTRHGGLQNLYWMRANGTGEAVRLMESKNVQSPSSFSPDGKVLAFIEIDNQTLFDLWTLPLESGESDHPKPGKPEVFLKTPFYEAEPAISPDGKWLAYESTESGSWEVYVRPFPGPGGRWQISTDGGGGIPRWSKSARELFYHRFHDSSFDMMVSSYTAKDGAFVASKPAVWAGNLEPSHYEITPDGKRLVAAHASGVDQKEPPQALVLLNFFDELRRKAAR